MQVGGRPPRREEGLFFSSTPRFDAVGSVAAAAVGSGFRAKALLLRWQTYFTGRGTLVLILEKEAGVGEILGFSPKVNMDYFRQQLESNIRFQL